VDLWAFFFPLVLQQIQIREREMGLVESTYNEGGKNSNQIKSNHILRISIDIMELLGGMCFLVSKNRRFWLVRITPELGIGMIFITRILQLRLEVAL
jgi:hypothetical protein